MTCPSFIPPPRLVAWFPAAAGTTPGLLNMRWQTPIWRVSLAKAAGGRAALEAINRATAELIHAEFETFVDARGSKLSMTGWEANGANQAFFEWQAHQNGWADRFAPSAEIRVLTKLFVAAADTMMLTIGARPDRARAGEQPLKPWATVHRDGLVHLPHTHPGHGLSGVYYVSVPPDAG